jgi:DNA invertase Pin-like site-specific DNA recombinase
MSRETLIQPHHLARQAIVYVRQSTTKQLTQHQESTRRQYQLTETAQQLGWSQSCIQIIDDDLGLSGTSSTQRSGFQRLVATISLGQVGIILVIEVSRLSRLNSDWHRVIELCAVFETLIADEDGLYDPRDPNDRLLLGLKGTLFSAELHILRARMRGGLLNKARRGALALRLPVGYRRRGDGSVVQDPDEQVRITIQTLFEQFALLKTGRAVLRYFCQHQLQMPRYIQTGPDAGRLIWVRPTYQMIQHVLTSPVYAGIFVYGRRVQQVQVGEQPRIITHRRLIEEWEIVVPDIYPAYISEAQYYANRELLHHNLYNFSKRQVGSQRQIGAPREGAGLLVGMLVCGRCGRRMSPNYSSDHRVYHCRQEQVTYDLPQCQAFPQRYLDQALQELFFEAVQPARLETMLSALDSLEHERQTLERQWQLKLERARYAVELAQRQYDAVDPDNRLVARELEKRWNTALVEQERLEQEYATARRAELAPLTEDEQQAVRHLADDLLAVWSAPTTTVADRKRLVRLAIQEVTVSVRADASRSADVTVLWSGGVTTSHTVVCPPLGWHCLTDATLLARIAELAQHMPDYQIAELLNVEGIHTHTGKLWTYQRVQSIRKLHQIATACPVEPRGGGVRGDGRIALAEAARQLGVSRSLVHLWLEQGVLSCEQRTARSFRWVHLSEHDRARLAGQHDWSCFPSVREVMQAYGYSNEQVWGLVRAGAYLAYRHAAGQRCEWRLQQLRPCSCDGAESAVG